MAIVFNGAVLDWYEEAVYMNGTAISTPDSPGDVYFNGTRVFGLSGSYDADIYGSASSLKYLVFDSPTLENNHVPAFQNDIPEAFHSQSYTQGPGQDSVYTVYVKEGYRVVSQDGTFVGTASPGTAVAFYEGKSVTGINTSHNGSTWFYIQRDDGV